MSVSSPQSLTALTVIFFCATQIGLAQKKAAAKQDSSVLTQTTTLLFKIDSTHRADSLRRVALLKEIENLKGSEANRQRDELLKQLRLQETEDSIAKAKQLAQLNALKSSAAGYPVKPFADTLFVIYTHVGSFSAADRAARINSRIEKLYDDYDFRGDSLIVIDAETAAEIVYKDDIVMSVNELDAMWFDQKPRELALEYRDKIKDAIVAEKKANSLMNILLRIAAVLLIVLGIYVVIRLINKLFKKIRYKVARLKDDVLKGIRFKGYQFLDSERELRVIFFLMNFARLMIIVIALYIALPLMFSVFPWTRGIAETLIGWVLSPIKNMFSGLVSYLPNLVTIIVIGFATHYVIKFLRFISGEIESGALTIAGFYPDWARPTMNIVKFLVYAFSFIIIFPYLPGSDSPIFQGVSVFVGILFSLGSSSAISNAVAGLVITYMRPFKVGDRIKIGDISGDVIEKTLLVTRIRTIKNEDITVPNAAILSGHTINYATSAKELGLILYTGVTIGYNVPWRQVHELLRNAASKTNGVMSDQNHQAFVLQTSLDDFYVSYQLNVYTEESNRIAAIYSDLHQNIQDAFNEAGVEIMSPHYRAARDGNTSTVPSTYLPKDYKSPTFNVAVQRPNETKDVK